MSVTTNKYKFNLLKDFAKIVNELENKTISNKYWEKEDRLLRKIIDKNNKFYNSLIISNEKYFKKF